MEIKLIQNEIDEHRQKWINHVYRMADERIQKQILQHNPK
jgi:hypothetical protein